ncbi:MAG: glycosyltransferase [Pseudomonadota bacterium]|nr:glycosyltransferase [Pseudomonadota bacterium]
MPPDYRPPAQVSPMKFEATASAPLLSLCIPTYNRSSTLLALVRRILSQNCADLQVVVLDNGSTDDTLTRLSEIDDPRLVVLSNGVNRGVLFNVVNVLVQGTGTYSALLLDKDLLDPTLIPGFLQFLREAQPECGYCEYGLPVDAAPRRFETGAPALRGVAYSCHHPTGYFFRTDSLRAIDITTRFTDYEVVGHFPFEFMQAELCVRGPAAIYQTPIFSPEVLQLAKSAKSHGTHAGREDAFFSPKGRLKMTVNFSHHISSLAIDPAVKRELIIDRFAQGLRQSTVEFRRLMADGNICDHYHIAPRRIGALETLRTGWWFHRQFSDRVLRCAPVEAKLTQGRLLVGMLRRFRQAISRRLARRFA